MKILEYYNYFSFVELNKLTLFLESPYFNNEGAVTQLHLCLYHLKQDTKNNPIKEVNFEEFFKKILPNKEYNENYLRVLFTKLIKLLERFLEIEYNEIPFNKKIETMNRFNLKKNYEGHIQKVLEQKPQDFKDDFYYLSTSLLYHDYNSYLNHSLGDHIEQYRKNIIAFNENFDIFFIYNKLRSLCNLINDKKILNLNYELSYKEELLKIIYSEKYDDIIPIKVYKLLYKMLNEEEDIYDDYVHNAIENSKKFQYDEVVVLLTFAQNYCIKQINASKFEYFDKMFELIKYRIEHEFVLSQGEIQPRLFKTIVNTALRVKESDWAYNFIKEYSKYLPASEYDKAYNFNMAFYMFEMNKYSKTIELLSKVEYDDLFYGFNVRLLLLKSYYELDEVEPLDHLLASFKIFVNRKKSGISENYKKAHLNVLLIVKKLISVNPRDKKKVQNIKNKFLTLKPIAEMGWLTEKFNEFKL